MVQSDKDFPHGTFVRIRDLGYMDGRVGHVSHVWSKLNPQGLRTIMVELWPGIYHPTTEDKLEILSVEELKKHKAK